MSYHAYLKKFDAYLRRLERYERLYGPVPNAQRRPFSLSEMKEMHYKRKAAQAKKSSCPTFTQGEEAAMKMMKHYCPGGYKEDWIPIFLNAIDSSNNGLANTFNL